MISLRKIFYPLLYSGENKISCNNNLKRRNIPSKLEYIYVSCFRKSYKEVYKFLELILDKKIEKNIIPLN